MERSSRKGSNQAVEMKTRRMSFGGGGSSNPEDRNVGFDLESWKGK